MKILVIGGSGMIGGDAAIHLAALGHTVTIGSRKPPLATTPMAMMPFLAGDYIAGGYSREELAGFDAMVFAAGQDTRHVGKDDDAAAYWERTNAELVPQLFERARDAGVGCAINIGSFYPQAAPHLLEGNAYIRSRKASDERVRALARPGFRVISLNPPYMLGAVPGLDPRGFEKVAAYADGKFPDIPVYAPPGGVNFMSIRSLAEATAGAIERGESGKAYLVGDENLSFRDYFQLFFRALGKDVEVPVIDKPHPLIGSFAGHGGEIYFDPDPAETVLLGYRRKDIATAVEEIVALYRGRN
nr:NAD(P)-dependent oxidoreductase [Sphingomonas sp. Y57]